MGAFGEKLRLYICERHLACYLCGDFASTKFMCVYERAHATRLIILLGKAFRRKIDYPSLHDNRPDHLRCRKQRVEALAAGNSAEIKSVWCPVAR